MGVTIQWLNKDKAILFCRITGNWNCDRFYTTLETMWQGLGQVDHPVDLIIDLSSGKMVAEKTVIASELVPDWCPPNLRYVILVGRGGPIYEVYGAFMWHRSHAYLVMDVRVMPSMDVALNFLHAPTRC